MIRFQRILAGALTCAALPALALAAGKAAYPTGPGSLAGMWFSVW